MADEMNGVRKLRAIADMEYSLVLSCELKDLADKIEREHMDEINVCRENEAKLINRIERLRKAIEYALNPDADREAAAGWVEEHGGLGAVEKELCESFYLHHRIAKACGINPHAMDAKEAATSVMAELDKRLMPKGTEWPRDHEGNKVDFGDEIADDTDDHDARAIDSIKFVGGIAYLFDRYGDIITVVDTGVGERVERPHPAVLGADGLPIKVGETVYTNSWTKYVVSEVYRRESKGLVEFVGEPKRGWVAAYLTHTQPDTQERIDDDATMPPRRYYAEKIDHDVDLKDDEEVFTAVALSLMRRQRELDAKTMGGE